MILTCPKKWKSLLNKGPGFVPVEYIFLHAIQGRNGFEDEQNFPRDNFHFPRSDSCLPSEARLDMSNQGKGKVPRKVLFIQESNFLPWDSMGEYIFSLCRGLSNHKSSLNKVILDLRYCGILYRFYFQISKKLT